MTPLKWVAIGLCLAALLAVAAGVSIKRYGAGQYAAGRQDAVAAQTAADVAAQIEANNRAALGAKGAQAALQAGAVAVSASSDAQQRDVTIVTRYIHDSPAPAVCAMRDDDPVLQNLRAAAASADTAADDLVRGTGSPGEGPPDVP